MLRWTGVPIKDNKLASACFALLRRQYNLVAELRAAIKSTCVVQANSEFTTLSSVVDDLRTLLNTDADADEEDVLTQRLNYLITCTVRFSYPGSCACTVFLQLDLFFFVDSPFNFNTPSQ
jgi:hypothetical protein